MKNPVIVSAVRTPIGRFLGTLSSIPATKLGAIAVAEAVARAGVPADQIDEVIMGNVVGAGLGQAPARQAAIGAGLARDDSGRHDDEQGLRQRVSRPRDVRRSGDQVRGDAELIVAGGMESMSNAPHMHADGSRNGYRMGHQIDRRLDDPRRPVGPATTTTTWA